VLSRPDAGLSSFLIGRIDVKVMTKKEVSFSIQVPDNISDSHLREGLQYYLEIYASISTNNPLSECDISELRPTNLSIS